MPGFSQRLGGHVYSVVHFLVKLLVVVLVLVMIAFVFLRVHGVPGPLLREAVRRLNEAGVPIDIAAVKLTLGGWRASDVRYYSQHPDDLKPMIQASEVLCKRVVLPDEVSSEKLIFDVMAKGVVLTPSVEWGVELPPRSALGMIESAQVAVTFQPDRIELSSGTLNWMGIDFFIDGTFLRKVTGTMRPDVEAGVQPVPPMLVSAETIRQVENGLKSLKLTGKGKVDIEFLVDPDDLAASTLVCALSINDAVFRDVTFSRAEAAIRYVYPQVTLEQASLYKDNQMFSVDGSYALDTRLAQVSVSNEILSKRLLLWLPARFLERLTGMELGFETLPRADLTFGPALFGELLNQVSGSFSIRNTLYRNLKIESLSGQVKRENGRLELLELKGLLGGQANRSAEFGSCMAGGDVAGEVFWDAYNKEYGVLAEGSFDPNLLLDPLSFSKTATNVIRRFRFQAEPPSARVELGQNYSMRDTFFINIQGSAHDVFVHDVPFTSVSTSVSYNQGLLTLDPVIASQGGDVVKGAASLDFKDGLATFDAAGSVSPEAMEQVIYPGSNLFKSRIRFTGKTKVSARGCVNWRDMQATDFEAQVEAEHCRLRIATLDNLSASVTGTGPYIGVRDAVFNIYGGQGSGELSLRLDPREAEIPYTLNVVLSNVDFSKTVKNLRPEYDLGVSGSMSGEAQLHSDFSRRFLEVTNGRGRIDVKDGQLADLPLFRGFSKAMRKVIPAFSVFSINSLSADFELNNGVISSDNAYFDGDFLSAKGEGSYSVHSGFDASVQAQVFSENQLSKVLRVITDPFFKLLELKLEGPLSDPSWRLEKFSGDSAENSSADQREN